MRNLQKLLALVLALVMSLALVTVASAKKASDFSDGADITYTEAVDVMTAIGVFEGVGNNTFEPDTVVTREQAAKIVTYMLMGKDKADRLTTTVAPYADVAAGRWSAGAIAYCTNEGILAGVGGGKFDPAGQLTGLQFAKIMLVALGYDAAQEKLVGKDWAINTAKLAITADLDVELEEIPLSSAMTREQAAQMAFNTLTADLVEYGQNTTVVTGDVTVSVSGKAGPIKYDKTKDYRTVTEDQDEIQQFCEKYFDKLKLEGTTGKDADAFGRPGTTWTLDDDEVTFGDKSPVLTYTAKVDADQIVKDLKGYKLKDTAAADGKKDIAVNSDDNYSPNSDNGKIYSNNGADAAQVPTSSNKPAEALAALTAPGTVVEFYANKDKVITNIVVIDTYIGEVGRVTEAKDDDARFVTLKGGKTYETESFKVGDVVLYTESKSTDADKKGIQSMQLAGSATGTLTKMVTKDSTTTYTVDGKEYVKGAQGTTSLGDGNLNKEVSFYVDQYGNIMQDITAGSEATKYIYVVAHSAAEANKSYITDAEETWTSELYGVAPDGSVVTYTAKFDESGHTAWADKNTQAGLYPYTVNDDGTLALGTKVESATGEIKAGDTKIDSTTILNSQTAFVFVELSTKENDKTVVNTTVKTGNKNIGATISGTTNHYTGAKDGVAEVVYVVSAYVDPAADTGLYVMVDLNSESAVKSKDGSTNKTSYEYTAYTSEYEKITVTSDTSLKSATNKGFSDQYAIYKLNDDKSVGAEIGNSEAFLDAEVTDINGSTVSVYKDADKSLNLTDDTAVYGLKDDTELLKGQKIAYVIGKDTKANDILAAWIVNDQVTYTLSMGDAKSDAANYTFAFDTVTLVAGSEHVKNSIDITATAKADGNKFTTSNNKYKLTVAVATSTSGKGTLDPADSTVSVTEDSMTATFTVGLKNVSDNVTLDISNLEKSQS